MNLTEKNEVISFLKRKKLSYPLYNEVLDHFCMNIENLMAAGVGFQEAFLKTKIKWQEEFQMVRPDMLSLKKIPAIEARTLVGRFHKMSHVAVTGTIFCLLLIMIHPPLQSGILVVLSAFLFLLVAYSIWSGKFSMINFLTLTFHPLILRVIAASVFLTLLGNYIPDDFSSNRIDYSNALTFATGVFNILIQIQLINFHNKKINVLVS